VVKFTPLDDKVYEGFISVFLEEIQEVIVKVTFEAECKIPKVCDNFILHNRDSLFLQVVRKCGKGQLILFKLFRVWT
jgi:hypothetical protein